MPRNRRGYIYLAWSLLSLLTIAVTGLAPPAHAAGPDLTVEDVWLERSPQPNQPAADIQPGETFNIIAKIRNIGDATGWGFYIDAYYDGNRGRGGPDNIAPGEAQEWYVGPLTGQLGTYTARWVVDPDNQIAESDELNNQREYSFTVGAQAGTATVTVTSSSALTVLATKTMTVTSYTSTYTSTVPVVVTMTVAPQPTAAVTVIAASTSTMTVYPTTTITVTSHTGTYTSIRTVVVTTTVAPTPTVTVTETATSGSVSSVVRTAAVTVTSYTSTYTSTVPVVVTTTVTQAPTVAVTSTVPVWSTEYVTRTLTATTTSHTSTTTVTSTEVVHATVTADGGNGSSSSFGGLAGAEPPAFVLVAGFLVGLTVFPRQPQSSKGGVTRHERRRQT